MKKLALLLLISGLFGVGCTGEDSSLTIGTPPESLDRADSPGTPEEDVTEKDNPDKNKPDTKPQDPPSDPDVPDNPPENPDDPTENPDDPTEQPDPNACEMVSCEGVDVCLTNDKLNCGECGHACIGDEASCVDGICMNECSGLVCSGACIDPQTDHDNCGQCGEQCGDNDDCIEGSCKPRCDGTQCGDECIDTTNDPNNCGGCGNACGDHMECNNSVCECKSGLTECNGVCVDLNTNSANCGACGTTCPAACLNAACAPENDQEVVDYARQWLFSETHKCTFDLVGIMPHLYSFEYKGNSGGFNYGYDMNCANFVAAVMIEMGRFPNKDMTSVKLIHNHCTDPNTDYHELDDPTQARPGDIWYTNTHTHAEIVVGFDDDHPGKIKLIGSNNYEPSDTIECLHSNKDNSKLSSDPTDYQRVTEQYRKIETGTVCSRF